MTPTTNSPGQPRPLFGTSVPARGKDPMTVLLVDDDDSMRELLRMTLERGPYHVEEACDGQEALEAVVRVRPSVIFLDVEMPGLSGYQVCQLLKSDPATRHVQVVMLTARGQQSDRAAGEQAGADGYMTKPFSPLSLLSQLDALSRTRAA